MPMLLLAAVVLAAAPPSRPASAAAQATASVQVISGVQLKLDGLLNNDAPPPRRTRLRAADGVIQPAKLIEFQ
jgi:hypothetical protein